MLTSRGFKETAGNNGGRVFTKPMQKAQAAVARIDPAELRPTPRGWADEVPHAHKEIVDGAWVSRRGDFDPWETRVTLDDSGTKTSDRVRTHIPIR